VATDIVPDRGRNVGQDHAQPRPDDDEDEPEDVFCDQEVDEKTN